MYNRITSTKSPSFCLTTFSASLTNLTVLLPQSHDCSCYVSTRILAPPPLWMQKHTDLRACDFAHSPHLWHQPRLPNVTCAWSWSLCGIKLGVQRLKSWSDCSSVGCGSGFGVSGNMDDLTCQGLRRNAISWGPWIGWRGAEAVCQGRLVNVHFSLNVRTNPPLKEQPSHRQHVALSRARTH